jgi:predicted secreted Zn-dependent protease
VSDTPRTDVIPDFAWRCEHHPDHQEGMVTHAMVALRHGEESDDLREHARQLERELAEARAECERLREDAERLDWMDRNAFTAYRDVDPEYGTLDDHATVVAEGRRERRGCVGTIRAAIDAARKP